MQQPTFDFNSGLKVTGINQIAFDFLL